MKSKFRLRLLPSVILAVFVGISAPMTIATLYNSQKLRSSSFVEAKKYFQRTMKTLTYGVQEALWDLTPDPAIPLLNALMEDEQIVRVTVYDHLGNIFASQKNPRIQDDQSGQTETLSAVIKRDGRNIGSVQVVFSLKPLQLLIRSRTIDNILMMLTVFMVCISLLVVLIHSRIILPIKKLNRHAQLLANRQLDLPFYWKSRDEIGELGERLETSRVSLKNLFKEIDTKNKELSSLNIHLEELVATKTQQLLHASKMSSLGEMASGIAHEINNPLTIIRTKITYLETLFKMGKADPENTHIALIKLVTTVDRIATIVRGLRSFARDGNTDPFIPTQLKGTILETVALCESRLKSENIAIELDPVSPNLICTGRPTQISQVLLNLIHNARDAVISAPEKWIRIEAREIGDRIQISVTDSGPGIPPKLADKIFQPFFTTKDINQGTGLGLSISLGIVQAHRGSLFLDARHPNTRFVIEIPKSQSQESSSVA